MKRKPCPPPFCELLILDNLQAHKYTVNEQGLGNQKCLESCTMETQAFTEPGSPHSDARTLRNRRFTWCLGACLVLWLLTLLPFLIACLLLHHQQSPKPCWFHASSPVNSQPAIHWTWARNCSSSAINATESSLEIQESSMYYTYVYVACKETGVSEEDHFTVELVTNSNQVLSILKGPNGKRTFVTLGRPYFLDKGTSLHLKINENLKNIDVNRTYWGLFKI
ncbi:uncharacterized protein LOC132567698 [Heteronotia binoei]|uniref:uncharacterized protein LOC132567698 n=1 Tax=Heteronotia binoei TaxID=13085 RepID=UPI00293108D5|nr:uncharacterized protein LOC132567698 [Heteronotia binoei]